MYVCFGDNFCVFLTTKKEHFMRFHAFSTIATRFNMILVLLEGLFEEVLYTWTPPAPKFPYLEKWKEDYEITLLFVCLWPLTR
jgi:uncharacterized membrane protein